MRPPSTIARAFARFARSITAVAVAIAAAAALAAACDSSDPPPADCTGANAGVGTCPPPAPPPPPPGPKCPATAPEIGASCAGPIGSVCSYDTCGAFVGFTCTDGKWKRAAASLCPVYVPTSGRPCECATDLGTRCEYCPNDTFVVATCEAASKTWRVETTINDAGLCGPAGEGGADASPTDAGPTDAADGGG
jgi:hypothetical protein